MNPSEWAFSGGTDPWTVFVNAVPRAGAATREFASRAVPEIAAAAAGPAPTPCVVVARVTTEAAPFKRAAAGPKGRAKALMDVLHDDRAHEPRYATLRASPPLPGDGPSHVRGLAVEVRTGRPQRVEYQLGDLQVFGDIVDQVPVEVGAPNDIAASSAERWAFAQARQEFCEALVSSWNACARAVASEPLRALVIRHRPGRDEDNTWETWLGALLGSAWSHDAWTGDSPLAGWRPAAVASLADPNLPSAVRYEFIGA